MDTEDFEMPSPKRQKTESPVRSPNTPATAPVSNHGGTEHTADAGTDNAPVKPIVTPIEPQMGSQAAETVEGKEQDMLDVLMQHVESETASRDGQVPGLTYQDEPVQAQHAAVTEAQGIEVPAENKKDIDMTGVDSPSILHSEMKATEPTEPIEPTQDAVPASTALPQGLEPASPDAINQLHTAAEAEDLPPTADTLITNQIPSATATASTATDEAVPVTAEAREWETDSSPYGSSSSDDSSTDSDSSDEDDDDDEYTLLDPYEQARILMAEDGGGGGDDGNSDDESRPASSRPNAGLRTVNEKPEEIIPKPNITITETMPIEELGTVQAIVENTVLITAKTSGEYRVLESHSLLCTASRIPIGVVAETLGRVEAPLYTVRFASEADIKESGVSEKGTKVYYVPEHSTFVFTQPLKAVKGSDASNFHDEEVGDDEMEFSDDEAEAEHKRQMKLRRKGVDPASVPPPTRGGRGGRGQRGRGGRGGFNNMHSIPESDTASAYGSASVEMNYDDVEEGETDYTPLRRPETFSQTSPHQVNGNSDMSPPQRQQNFNFRGNQDSRGGRGGHRGRGNHNNNHNNRGRGGGRGGNNYNQNNNRQPYTTNQTYNQSPTANAYPLPTGYSPSSTTSMYANNNNMSMNTTQLPQTQTPFHSLPPPPPLPAAPYLTPSSGPYSANSGTYTILPSPMTPLPAGNFTFSYDNVQYPGHGQSQNQSQQQQQQQQQQQNQWAQYHANLNQYQAMYGGSGNGPVNSDAIAQVQRTLEELRRNAGNGGYGGQQ